MRRVSLFGSMLLAALVVATAADARCTKLGFSVNDYGKDGPTKDAKDLLDKYIAKWAAERGIKKYTTGKKNVTCELYLDVGLFDEHTCKAEALVCWDGVQPPATAPGAPKATRPAPAAAPAKSAATPASAPVAPPAPAQSAPTEVKKVE